jgi:hypothetical protein
MILVVIIEENHEKAQTIAQHSCRIISEQWYYRKRDNDFRRAHYFGGGWAHAEECTRVILKCWKEPRTSYPAGVTWSARRPQQFRPCFLSSGVTQLCETSEE